MALLQAGTVKVASSTEKQVPAVTSVATLESYLTTNAFNDDARQTVSLYLCLAVSAVYLCSQTPVDSMQALQ